MLWFDRKQQNSVKQLSFIKKINVLKNLKVNTKMSIFRLEIKINIKNFFT